METVPVTKDIPKDFKEAVDVIAQIADHFLQKKPWEELMAALPNVVKAVDGWENVVGSVKGKHMGESAGYLVGELTELFEKDEAPAAE